MFKSIFTRYLATFIVIIGASFFILVFIVASMFTTYSNNEKEKLMKSGAENTLKYLTTNLNKNYTDDIYKLVLTSKEEINAMIEAIASLTNSDVYIIDTEGKLIMTTDNNHLPGEAFINKATLNIINTNPNALAISDLNGTFSRRQMNKFELFKPHGDYSMAIVLLSTEEVRDVQFFNDVRNTVVIVSLWIFIGVLISVYFVTEKIVEPIKKIGKAARNFALGKFDQRVTVTGQDEVAELAKGFNNMAASLARLEETRSAFLANVSHDLRTPMTTIAGFVDGILDGTIPQEKHDYYLEIIAVEVRRLARLVNSLLEISRLEAGESKLKRSDFNITEKTRQVIISLEKKIDAKDLEIEFNNDEEIYVNADMDAIHQVIYNLLENAIKFTGEKGKIKIALTINDKIKKQKTVRVSVKNTGEGIPPDELPLVFDRFYKSDRSRGLDKTGTGLGLYIVKTTISAHGEEIEVNSVQGEYTEFAFNLPYSEK